MTATVGVNGDKEASRESSVGWGGVGTGRPSGKATPATSLPELHRRRLKEYSGQRKQDLRRHASVTSWKSESPRWRDFGETPWELSLSHRDRAKRGVKSEGQGLHHKKAQIYPEDRRHHERIWGWISGDLIWFSEITWESQGLPQGKDADWCWGGRLPWYYCH